MQSRLFHPHTQSRDTASYIFLYIFAMNKELNPVSFDEMRASNPAHRDAVIISSPEPER